MTTTEIHNTEFEEAVVGGILANGTETLETVLSTGLDFGDFYDEKLRLVFRSAVELASTSKVVDFLTVKNHLAENDRLEKVGAAFLGTISSGIPTAINIKSYAEQVVKDARRRRVLASLSNAMQAATSGNGDFDSALGNVAQAISEQRREKGEHQFRQITEDRFSLEVPEVARLSRLTGSAGSITNLLENLRSAVICLESEAMTEACPSLILICHHPGREKSERDSSRTGPELKR